MVTINIPSIMSVVMLNLEGLGCITIYIVVVAVGIIQAAKLIKMKIKKIHLFPVQG